MITPRSNRNLAAERHYSLERRRFLRGLGVCLALPAFESLLPRGLLAASTSASATAATTATGAPLRMAYLVVPNGIIPASWWPDNLGKDFTLNATMKSLGNVKDKMQIISGLADAPANAGGDGGGDHGRGGGTFLTAVRCKKTQGADIHAGISVDQVAAQAVGHVTPFASLQLSCDTVQNAGNCDSGYSCVYQHNISWSSPTTPLSPETNPRLLFERLFGSGAPSERRQNMILRQQQQHSILDFVSNQTKSVEQQLSARDNQKLDEFLTSVREIELRIQRAEQAVNQRPDPGIEAPASGIPASFTEYVRLNLDMMHLAFLTDNTRIATFIFAGEGNNRDFTEIGVPEGHHYCTHHGNNPEKIAKTCVIDNFYATQLAYFLEKMEKSKDVDGKSLLDNSMIMYGSAHADGNRHTHDNLPIILAGGAGGSVETGRYIKQEGPIANLYLSMLDRMGVPPVDRFGDSTGRLQIA